MGEDFLRTFHQEVLRSTQNVINPTKKALAGLMIRLIVGLNELRTSKCSIQKYAKEIHRGNRQRYAVRIPGTMLRA